MKVTLKFQAGNILYISEEIYCDPSKDKIHQIAKELLKVFENIKNEPTRRSLDSWMQPEDLDE